MPRNFKSCTHLLFLCYWPLALAASNPAELANRTPFIKTCESELAPNYGKKQFVKEIQKITRKNCKGSADFLGKITSLNLGSFDKLPPIDITFINDFPNISELDVSGREVIEWPDFKKLKKLIYLTTADENLNFFKSISRIETLVIDITRFNKAQFFAVGMNLKEVILFGLPHPLPFKMHIISRLKKLKKIEIIRHSDANNIMPVEEITKLKQIIRSGQDPTAYGYDTIEFYNHHKKKHETFSSLFRKQKALPTHLLWLSGVSDMVIFSRTYRWKSDSYFGNG